MDSINIENKFNEAKVHSNRAKFKQIDKDITCILSKARKEIERPIIEIEKSIEKRKFLSLVPNWKVMVKKTEENHASKGIM